ncbi:aldose epimerase family protein [Zymomonas mobilis]|uniref:Aldose 1-epimerase n=1 Tax=Zymomonas mobilis subsp. mobilis (strain ATCC 31821 / ZM4 / CP4) TaxID=264203 RepID=A0A806CZX6_ZYMMO|nr:aldose epimerase family protein [Zymomonas mobilis]ADC33831.1 Aldose 1-epimerase [Zymomonas mobilis subsp. mobilis ZM4 = ATCC 31821]AHB11086.1 aldose 1-epimerase [Zymomonas mobilis subsp. mobilis str. CP4 = NRRL B-14023]AHJ71364.1 galactose-1-epimerase [Zymomonas mobilis subsp. mobilis NRRL B-12526]AHJ73206.1 galactose-1-epimerase [Zymomonas mobilis subsp. mobilis str. CP4 = NRRL B-14023]
MTEIAVTNFGEHEGEKVFLFTLSNSKGTRISVTNYGCIITELWVADRQGNQDDIVLGFDKLSNYQTGHPFFGAIAGRCANRIAEGQFALNNKNYTLAKNEIITGQHLHGGIKGFDKYLWHAEVTQKNGVVFSRLSPNGEEGYPGNLKVEHSIHLTDDNRIVLEFMAETDMPTIVNMVNHSYYNLDGHKGKIENLELEINADFYTPVDEKTMLPNGEILGVKNTAFDFTHRQKIAEAMKKRPNHDFDVNYVLRKNNSSSPDVTLYSPQSGRKMEIYTTCPAVQFYNGFKLSNKIWNGKEGHRYQAFSGLCLETQSFPDSIHYPHFSNISLYPGEKYYSRTEHLFTIGG